MEDNEQITLWTKMGQRLYLDEPMIQFPKLNNVIYKLFWDEYRKSFYLKKVMEKFTFGYKLYGLETSLIERVAKTYANTENGNIGILLNGLKGTGKTVSAKIMCNRLAQPVVIVDAHYENCHNFLNSIPENITILIDEYEKVFGEASDMLTIMDGALNSAYRRVFIFTTNNLYVDGNLIQRPGRIRYLKKFRDLAPEVVEEIVDDILQHKQFKDECVRFISSLEVITVDIVKAVILEVNIHEEPPEAFANVFNVVKLKGKYNIFCEEEGFSKFEPMFKNITISPKPMYDDNQVGNWCKFDDEYVGRIHEIIDYNTFILTPVTTDKDSPAPEWLKGPMKFRIESADVFHYNYTYGASMFGGAQKNQSSGKRPLKIKTSPRYEDMDGPSESMDMPSEPSGDYEIEIGES